MVWVRACVAECDCVFACVCEYVRADVCVCVSVLAWTTANNV